MKTINKLLLLSAMLIMVAQSSFAQQPREVIYYRSQNVEDSAVRVIVCKRIYLDKKSYLQIDYSTNDTVLVKKGDLASPTELAEDLRIMKEKLDKIDPLIPIKTAMTGFPIMDKIEENIASVPTKKLDMEKFLMIARTNLRLTLDYLLLSNAQPDHKHAFNTNTALRNNICYYRTTNSICYIDGKYFPKSVHFIASSKGCCHKNAHLIAVNNKPTAQAYQDNIGKAWMIYWDPVYKKFYSDDLYCVSNKNKKNQYLLQNEYEYNKMIKGRPRKLVDRPTEYKALDADYPVVWHNDENKILYIHIPTDGYYTYYNKGLFPSSHYERKAFIDTLINRIQQFKNKAIDKIVIDLRFQNPSIVPVKMKSQLAELLSAIIDESLYIVNEQYIRNTPEAIEFITKEYMAPVEGGHTKEVFGTSYRFHSTYTDTIAPLANSLNHKGEIIFFVDRSVYRHYSLLLTDLSHHKQIKIWGVPNGAFLNKSFSTSFRIEMPNTGTRFECTPLIIFPSNLDDFYNGGISKRIFLTIEQETLFRTHKGHIFNFDFLKTNDPYLRELLGEL